MNKKILAWLLLCLIWGSTWSFIKIGLEVLPPLTFAALRFLLSALILWGIAAWRKIPPPKTRYDWITMAGAGVLGFSINYSLLFWGEKYITSGLASVLQAMIPAFGLIFAHYFLPGEKITRLKIIGVLIGIFGVALIFSNQFKFEGSMAVWGSVALFSSAFFVAASNVIVKARGVHLDPIVSSAAQMSIGVIPMILISIWWEGNPLDLRWTGAALFALSYLTLIGAVFAFALYYWLIRHWDVTKTMLISLVTPVIAVAIGMITLGEKVTWQIAAGTILILAGVGAIIGEQLMRKILGVQES